MNLKKLIVIVLVTPFIWGCFKNVTKKQEDQKLTKNSSQTQNNIEVSEIDISNLKSSFEVFFNSLNSNHKKTISYKIDSDEWKIWTNIHASRDRVGLMIGLLTEEQKQLFFDFLKESMSVKGLKLSQDIILLNQVLSDITTNPNLSQKRRKSPVFSEDEYYIVLFGTPSLAEPWGFQFEGHHLVINYYISKNKIIFTPTFFGSEPTVTPAISRLSEKYQNLSILQEEKKAGLALINSFTQSQEDQGIKVKSSKYYGLAKNLKRIPKEGILGKDLNENQKEQLLNLIYLFMENYNEKFIKDKKTIIKNLIDDTYFIFYKTSKTMFYYRIFNDEILIEFELQKGAFTNEEHIHSTIRTPNGEDYGENLLRKHLEQSHSF